MGKTIALIPARGGSKRIPGKNIKLFHGKPLIAYSIETARQTGLFDRIIVSTDDKEIAEIARDYGAEVPFLRDPDYADDHTTAAEAVEYSYRKLEETGEKISFACTIYATAPLLRPEYLIEGLEALKNSEDAWYAFSATSMPFPIQRTFRLTKDGKCEMFWPEHFDTRSQDLEEAYQDAGQFYWEIRKEGKPPFRFAHYAIPVILPRYMVQDIDTLEDWERAELMYEVIKGSKK
ncbi:N-acetylneuraminate cytidylyltransferase [Hydrogenimonas sp.]|nr:N-acetylneuraminate cytidylyltransferase [Hydrogenimonas sp.]